MELSGAPAKNPKSYKKIKNMIKTPRGTMYIRQQNQLTAVLWKDSRIVSLLSSAHNGYRNKETDFVERKVKNEKNKLQKTKVKAPPQAIDYIKNMRGEDRVDQLRVYHTCSRKSQLWWRKILYFLVDVARVNASVLQAPYESKEG